MDFVALAFSWGNIAANTPDLSFLLVNLQLTWRAAQLSIVHVALICTVCASPTYTQHVQFCATVVVLWLFCFEGVPGPVQEAYYLQGEVRER